MLDPNIGRKLSSPPSCSIPVLPFSHQVSGEEFKLERTFDYVSPGKMYTVVGGEKKLFTLH